MGAFRSFRTVVLLISLLLGDMWSTATGQSVAELEGALKNCQDSWRRMYDRYQRECGKINELVRRTNETRARLDSPEMPLSLRRKHSQCMDRNNECEAIFSRWNAFLASCQGAGRSETECFNAQASRQLNSESDACWERYRSCRDAYNNEKDEWETSRSGQREAYDRDMQKIQACRQLEGQYRSIVESCTNLEKELTTARSSRQQAPVTTCVSIDGPRIERDRMTFTAALDRTTQASLLNVQYVGGYSWLLDGRPLGGTNSTVTIQSPPAGAHEIRVKFWINRTGTDQVLCDAGKPFDTGAPPGSTGRMVKVGYVNYQNLPGFTVTVNGTGKPCSGGCSFEVPAGPCTISVQASGYKTESFQHTCDKDENMMTSLGKTP